MLKCLKYVLKDSLLEDLLMELSNNCIDLALKSLRAPYARLARYRVLQWAVLALFAAVKFRKYSS